MTVELVRIGNSRGIRTPKPLIEECGFTDAVEVKVENRRLVITSRRKARDGWEEAFRAAVPEKPAELLAPLVNRFDNDEWQW